MDQYAENGDFEIHKRESQVPSVENTQRRSSFLIEPQVLKESVFLKFGITATYEAKRISRLRKPGKLRAFVLPTRVESAFEDPTRSKTENQTASCMDRRAFASVPIQKKRLRRPQLCRHFPSSGEEGQSRGSRISDPAPVQKS